MKDIYFSEILELISKNRTLDALELLLEYAGKYGVNELMEFAVLSKSRLIRIKEEDRNGRLRGEDYNIEVNRINSAIIESINVLKNEPIGRSINEPIHYGHIIHNVPSRMSRNVPKLCKVRIASKEDILFDKMLKKEDASQPEELELTETMEVELYDPNGGEAFLIEKVNRESIQIVEDHAFTEWKFRVTPLLEGARYLELRAFLYKKKGKKELSFETRIEVVAYDGDFYAKEALPPWKTTDEVINIEGKTLSKPQTNRFFSFFGPGFLKAAIVFAVLFALPIIGYLLYKIIAPDNLPEETLIEVEQFPITLKIDPELKIQLVKINADTIRNWEANADTSEIYLPGQKPFTYYVAVKGSNGVCDKMIHLAKDSVYFVMNCSINEIIVPDDEFEQVPPTTESTITHTESATPRPRFFSVEVITQFKDPVIKIDGAPVKPDSNYYQQDKLFVSIFNRVKKGQHDFEVADQIGKFDCDGTKRTINVIGDNSIEFNCTRIIPTHEVKIRFIGAAGYLDEDIWVTMDGQRLETEKKIDVVENRVFFRRTIRKDLVFTLKGIKEGSHTFQITKACNTTTCPLIKKVINTSMIFNYQCSMICVN